MQRGIVEQWVRFCHSNARNGIIGDKNGRWNSGWQFHDNYIEEIITVENSLE